MNLAEKWASQPRSRVVSFPTSVRLRPDVDVMLQNVLRQFPHLTQSQIINDLLYQSLCDISLMIPGE